jgi:REP element-mobilizing transposase RayT
MSGREPCHVTLKLRPGLPRLRQRAEYAALRAAFARAKERYGCRLVHYAVLNDHMHLVIEAPERAALRRALQGLVIGIALALNRLWRRKGKVFADRYHDRVLKTPREVRNVLVYVFGNARHHAAMGRMVTVPAALDTFTSAPWFDGFREHVTIRGLETIERPTTDARSWLLRTGWRRHGLLDLHEVPSTPRAAQKLAPTESTKVGSSSSGSNR